MFRARKCHLFYFLFIFLVLFENCSSDDDEKYIQSWTVPRDECQPPTVNVFYSPVDKVSWRFLKNKIKPALKTEIGQHLNLFLHPITNCELRRVGYHLGDTENDHKPIICTSGPDEATLALEHYCAYYIFTKGHTWGKGWGQRDQKRKGMLDGVNYCLCTLKGAHLPAEQRIERCRKTVKQEYRNKIENCLDEKVKFWTKKAFEIYEKTTFGYYPYIVINNNHTTQWDNEAVVRFDYLIRPLMHYAAKNCKKFKPE